MAVEIPPLVRRSRKTPAAPDWRPAWQCDVVGASAAGLGNYKGARTPWINPSLPCFEELKEPTGTDNLGSQGGGASP